MGAICAVFSRQGATGAAPDVEAAFARAVARSPYRGIPASIRLPQGILGIQAIGEDASLGAEGPWHVALHGWISNWDDLIRRFSLCLPPGAQPAQRFAMAFAGWGENFARAARGEFAAVVVDSRNGSVSAIRGHLGTKPLFHMQSEKLLVIASEIRQVIAGCGVEAPLDIGVLIELAARVSLAREATCREGVSRVLAANLVEFQDGERRHTSRYWLPEVPDPLPQRSLDELAEETLRLLFQAVERSIPASPFAVAMSGGLDSTTIWALTRALAIKGVARAEGGVPISLVFPEDPLCDESRYIDAMLAHTGSVGLKVDASRANPLDYLSAQTESMDASASGTVYHIDLLATCSQSHGAKVLLVGIGGDEWFQGSLRYLADDFFLGHPFKSLRKAWGVRVPEGASRLEYLWRQAFRPQNLRARMGLPSGPAWLSNSARTLLSTRIRESLRSSRPRRARIMGRLFDILFNYCGFEIYERIEQRAASLGLETRNPFLDQDLVEFAFRVDPRDHLAEVQSKHLLRRSIHGYLPEVVRVRRDKTVFDSNFNLAAHRIIGSGWNPGTGVLAQKGILKPVTDILVDQGLDSKMKKKVGDLSLWELFCLDRFVNYVVSMSEMEGP